MLRNQTIYTKKLGIRLAKKAKGSKGKYHIIPIQAKKWNLVAEGSLRSLKTFHSKSEALDYAKNQLLLAGSAQIVVHNSDGKILDKITF